MTERSAASVDLLRGLMADRDRMASHLAAVEAYKDLLEAKAPDLPVEVKEWLCQRSADHLRAYEREASAVVARARASGIHLPPLRPEAVR